MIQVKRRIEADVFGASDVGQVRSTNEDQFLVARLGGSVTVERTGLQLAAGSVLHSRTQGHLLVVADGMGGHENGERAAAIAVQTVLEHVLEVAPWFFRLEGAREDELVEELEAAIEESQAAIVREFGHHGDRLPGTTVTIAYVLWPSLWVVHAGDSRCYLARGGRLKQVTTDHTVAQRLVDEGVLDPEKASRSRMAHILYKAVGGGSQETQPDSYKHDLQPGDGLLLCTDGLSKHLADREIVRHVTESGSARETCERLIEAANAAGGSDNVAVVFARFADALAEQRPTSREETGQQRATGAA